MFRTSTNADQLQAEILREIDRGERAVTRAMDGAKNAVRDNWREQIRSAGLGNRLPNTIRGQRYPQAGQSLNAAALIWSKAPEIVGSHERGDIIRSKDGFWLSIPTEAAGAGAGGRRLTGGEWKQRRGMRLRFVYRPGKASLLVADDARVSKSGQARRKGGRRRKDGILTGAQTVVIFFLVPQVSIRKKLDLMRDADMIASQLPGMIAAAWEG